MAEDTKFDFSIDELLESKNIAEMLSEEQTNTILDDLVPAINSDEASRADWEMAIDHWTELVTQVIKTKNEPWPNAANVKYPLLTIAATQFAARAYSGLLPGTNWVRGKVIGNDDTGKKFERAARIGKHMTYQLMDEIEEWEDDMDRMMHILPITGVAFKKTYFSESLARNRSDLVNPKDLIINYNAVSLEQAERKTHLLYFFDNELEERYRLGTYFRPIKELSKEPNVQRKTNENSSQQLQQTDTSYSSLREVCECHCFLDLDGDGYKEPYIVTLSRTQSVLFRVVPNYEKESIVYNPDNAKEIAVIIPDEYFTSYIFIPDPNSGVYGLGFGHLLGPLNEAINTIINQLLDAGSLSNMQAGFISKSFQIQGGKAKFKPGEWKIVNNLGKDMRDGIFPLPVRDPSGVLFNLLGMLENSGMKIASVTDILTGDIPGQNTKATVAMAAIEQGLKVFTSIHKRMHRSFKKELRKLFKLNSKFLSDEEYFKVMDEVDDKQEAITKADYDNSAIDIMPYSDPNVSSEQMRLAKVQALFDVLPLGNVNPQVVTARYLEATEQPGISELMQMPEPGPSLEMMQLQFEQAQFQHKAAMEIWDRKLQAMQSDLVALKTKSEVLLNVAKAEAAEAGSQTEQYKVILDNLQKEETRLLGLYSELVQQGPQQGQEGRQQPQ
jgi:chaperonin GroES